MKGNNNRKLHNMTLYGVATVKRQDNKKKNKRYTIYSHNSSRLLMPRGSIVLAFNSKRFGRVGEIQAHWSKVKMLLLQRCVRNQITSDRRYKQVWSDRVLCISFILSMVDNRIPRAFSLSNMAAAGEDLGKWLYSGRHYPCLLNKGNADSEERDLMQAFLSPEPSFLC